MSVINIKFSYFISRNAQTVVVTFLGDIDHESTQLLEHCKSEIQEHLNAAVMVFNFGSVKNITVDSYGLMTALQKSVRDSGASLKVCALSEYLTGKLVPQGVFRKGEMATTLKDALIAATREVEGLTGGKKSA